MVAAVGPPGHGGVMDPRTVAALCAVLASQDGVASWSQLRDTGLQRHDLERMLRRRELVRVHRRVYVDHTGPLTWSQRAWAAVLHAAPAALCLESAEPRPDPAALIHVAVASERRVTATAGIQVHRLAGFADLVRWSAGPPRLKVEPNVLERVDRAGTESEVIRLLSDAVGSRRTTVPRLRDRLAERSRMSRREWIGLVLDDLESGACSVLEQGYLTRVERPHGLPAPRRQAPRRGESGIEYRDGVYDDLGVVIELDGQLGHAGWRAAGRDADRDLDARADGDDSVRIRWAQVFDRPCLTARRLARLFERHGWAGSLRPCGHGCAAVGR